MTARTLQCDPHGPSAYRDTILCSCGRVYQMQIDGEPFVPIVPNVPVAPRICACGRNLPKALVKGGVSLICTQCFLERLPVGGVQ
jgi:hypothetical protein